MQSVLAKWYCGCLTILLEMELRNVGKGTKVGTKYILLHLRRAEVQLISPRPLDCWRRLQESAGLSLVSSLVPWM